MGMRYAFVPSCRNRLALEYRREKYGYSPGKNESKEGVYNFDKGFINAEKTQIEAKNRGFDAGYDDRVVYFTGVGILNTKLVQVEGK